MRSRRTAWAQIESTTRSTVGLPILSALLALSAAACGGQQRQEATNAFGGHESLTACEHRENGKSLRDQPKISSIAIKLGETTFHIPRHMLGASTANNIISDRNSETETECGARTYVIDSKSDDPFIGFDTNNPAVSKILSGDINRIIVIEKTADSHGKLGIARRGFSHIPKISHSFPGIDVFVFPKGIDPFRMKDRYPSLEIKSAALIEFLSWLAALPEHRTSDTHFTLGVEK